MRRFSRASIKLSVLLLLIFTILSLLEIKTVLEENIFEKDQKSQQLIISNNNLKLNISKDEFDEVMAWRIENMKSACKHHGLDKSSEDVMHQPNPWEYLIAKRDNVNLVWCNVFKSGSSRYMFM